MIKKIFIIILFACVVQAQTFTPSKKDIKFPWAYTHQIAGDTLSLMVYVMKIDSLVLHLNNISNTADSLMADLANVKTTISYATSYYGYVDSVSTETDSIDFASTKWTKGEIEIDDTVEVCWVNTFHAGDTFVFKNTSIPNTIPSYSAALSSKLYIRRYGGAGTVHYIIRMSGN